MMPTPFPTSAARAPTSKNGLLDRDTWHRMFVAAHVADQFRDSDACRLNACIAEMISGQGAAVVARILEENTSALAALRGVVATLSEADRRIAAAADRCLAQEGA